MKRRVFLLYTALIFTPYVKAKGVNSLKILLSEVEIPFKQIKVENVASVKAWIDLLPKHADVDTLSRYIYNLAIKDYRDNKVIVMEGVILSRSESMLYQAKIIYA